MSKQAAFPFAPDEIVVALESFTGVIDGEDVFVTRGDRLRGDHPAVRLHGEQFFKHDGERRAYEAPEVADEVPHLVPMTKVPMLRTRRDWTATRTAPAQYGQPPQKVRISLHGGRTIRSDVSWLSLLTDRERRELFEVLD